MRLIGWLMWGIELAGGLVIVVLAPIASVYSFVTGEPKQGLLALGLFVAGLVYLVLMIFDVIDRPWARRRGR
jgi:phosphatidylglycerophosphate synthase